MRWLLTTDGWIFILLSWWCTVPQVIFCWLQGCTFTEEDYPWLPWQLFLSDPIHASFKRNVQSLHWKFWRQLELMLSFRTAQQPAFPITIRSAANCKAEKSQQHLKLLYWALPASPWARGIRVMPPLPWIKEDLLFCLSNQTVIAVEDRANVCAGTMCSERLWVSLWGRTVTD